MSHEPDAIAPSWSHYRSDYARREFLLALGALGVSASRSRLEGAGGIRLGYAAITWGGKDEQAIADISAVGFKAIQPHPFARTEHI
jgi:hypothetical protein